MVKCWPILNFSIFIGVSALSGVAYCSETCATEIHINDPQAQITVDGEKIGVGHALVFCKGAPQTVQVVSSDQRTFSRVLASAADFSPQEKFWNIRLQDYSPNQFNRESINTGSLALPELKALSQEISELQSVVQKLKSLTEKTQASAVNSAPGSATFMTPSTGQARQVANSQKALQFELVPGHFVQIQAFPGLKAIKTGLSEKLTELHSPLAGLKITLCPTHVTSLKQDWTKVLVGPFSTAPEANSLAQNLGGQSFAIHNPNCAKNLTTHFQVEP